MNSLKISFVGLSITSSWGNGHATTFRSLIKELHKMGHQVSFLERDVPWYAENRDMPDPEFCELHLYENVDDLKENFNGLISDADVVIQGSYVPDGVAVAEWLLANAKGVKAFYDIDTPITLQLLEEGECEYLKPYLIPMFDIYLSFTGGPILKHLEQFYGAALAKPLYCSVDPELYHPVSSPKYFDLGYLGTYSQDRQPALEELLLKPARALSEYFFSVTGPLYPKDIKWPLNVSRTPHLPPQDHVEFYNMQRFTLNITRAAMVKWGYAPSVRLFEAMACGTVVISDCWEGLNSFFQFGEDILVANSCEEVLGHFARIDEKERRRIGENGRRKILQEHTSAIRALQLIGYANGFLNKNSNIYV